MYELVYIKDILLLIERNILYSGGKGFPFSLSEGSFTICPLSYNRKYKVLSTSLNKTSWPLNRSLLCANMLLII